MPGGAGGCDARLARPASLRSIAKPVDEPDPYADCAPRSVDVSLEKTGFLVTLSRWRRMKADTAMTQVMARRGGGPADQGFMFDVDGTLLLSDRSLGGYEVLPVPSKRCLELSERSVPFVLLTNGSAYPPAEQAARLRKSACRSQTRR